MSKGDSSRKGIALTFPDHSPPLRGVRAVTRAEVMEERCLLVCSYMDGLACGLITQGHDPYRGGATQLAGSSHVNHYENAL